MKLNELRNILFADRYILSVGMKEHQFRKSELTGMYKEYGNHNVIKIYSFPSSDNAIEIRLETSK